MSLTQTRSTKTLRCPSCFQSQLTDSEQGLRCPCGIVWKEVDGMIDFIHPPELRQLDRSGHTTSGESAAEYDRLISWLCELFGGDEVETRDMFVSALELREGDSVLETACGTGSNLEALFPLIGPEGEAHGLDLSQGMLRLARERLQSKPFRLWMGNATVLPFHDDTFDAVLHVGAINRFPDIPAAFSEMVRVLKPGRKLVVADEGLAPWLAGTSYGENVKKLSPLFSHAAPVDAIPPDATDVRVRWYLGDAFWMIELRKSAPATLRRDISLFGDSFRTVGDFLDRN